MYIHTWIVTDNVTHQVHRILAMKEFSQLDLVQLRFTSQIVELWKLDRLVADVNIEFGFAYGSFGYGYSNIFMKHSTRPAKDFVRIIIAYSPVSRNLVSLFPWKIRFRLLTTA